MKKLLFPLFLAALIPAAAVAQELNVLCVGNSFSWSVRRYLPQIVAGTPGASLVLEHASLGGCPFRRHWSLVEKSEADPAFKPYQDQSGKFSLKEKLQSRKWDVITIQQASGDSWQADTYQPYARRLFDYIRKYAPQAEVVIQQTWAYRFDEPRLAQWKIDQQQMYDRLTANYRQLAEELKCRQLPTGYAVQLARQLQQPQYVPYDPAILNTLKAPALPPSAGSLVNGHKWSKDRKTGAPRLILDAYHLNRRGEYLQACVWFTMLYGRPVSASAFVPEDLDAADAAFLRGIAQQAADNFPQAVKK